MRKFMSILLTFGLLVTVLFTSCNQPLSDETLSMEIGFTIQLPGNSSARSAYWTQDDAAKYQVIVTYDNSEVYNNYGTPGQSIKIIVDTFGTYKITVKAFDNNDTLLASGSGDKEVSSTTFDVVTVILNPKLREISFGVNIVWGTPEAETNEQQTESAAEVEAILSGSGYTYTYSYDSLDRIDKIIAKKTGETVWIYYSYLSNGTKYVYEIQKLNNSEDVISYFYSNGNTKSIKKEYYKSNWVTYYYATYYEDGCLKSIKEYDKTTGLLLASNTYEHTETQE